MSSFAIRTNVKDLLVTIESPTRGIADIFIHGITYIPEQDPMKLPSSPTFYLEHAKRGVRATFIDILKEVERGVNYHFIWDEFNKKEFENWLEARLFMQDILVDLGHK